MVVTLCWLLLNRSINGSCGRMHRKVAQDFHVRIELHSLNVQCKLMARQLTASHYLYQQCTALNFADVQLCLMQQAVQLALGAGYPTVWCFRIWGPAMFIWTLLAEYPLECLQDLHKQLRKAQRGSLMSCVMWSHFQNAGRIDHRHVTIEADW